MSLPVSSTSGHVLVDLPTENDRGDSNELPILNEDEPRPENDAEKDPTQPKKPVQAELEKSTNKAETIVHLNAGSPIGESDTVGILLDEFCP